MLAALLLVASSLPSTGAPTAQPALANEASANGAYVPGYRSGCIRSLREFAWELSGAVEAGDVNRLAALYRWRGMSTRAGYDTMARLQEIVARPLLQVEPVYARPREAFLAAPAASAPAATSSGPAASVPASPFAAAGNPPPPGATSSASPPTPARPGPVIWEPAVPDAFPLADPFDPAPVRGPPVALRLDQTLANGVTPASTTLRLQRELGCWWVSL